MTTQAHNEDTIKSLLEKPIEKPEPLLSEVAYSNLYSISHNVQAGNVVYMFFRVFSFIIHIQDFLHYLGIRKVKKEKGKKKKKQIKKKNQDKNKKKVKKTI